MRRVKGLFDPHNRLNPGKIVDAPSMTDNLRDSALPPAEPLRTRLEFDVVGGMRGAADRCMNIGLCRKSDSGTMCPSYMATLNEEDSTRGRANALVKALSDPDPHRALGGRTPPRDPRPVPDVQGVQERMPARRRHGHPQGGDPLAPPRPARSPAPIKGVRRPSASSTGSARPPPPCPTSLARIRPLRLLMDRAAGHRRRPVRCRSSYAAISCAGSAARRPGAATGTQGTVTYLADSFTTYTEPGIGRPPSNCSNSPAGRSRWRHAAAAAGPPSPRAFVDEAKAQARKLTAAADGVGAAGLAGRRLRAVLPDDTAGRASGDAAGRAGRAGHRRTRTPGRGAARRRHRRRPAPAERGRPGPPDAESSTTATAIRRPRSAPPRPSRCSSGSPAPRSSNWTPDAAEWPGSFGFESEHYDLSVTIGERPALPRDRRRTRRDGRRRHRRLVPPADLPRDRARRLAPGRAGAAGAAASSCRRGRSPRCGSRRETQAGRVTATDRRPAPPAPSREYASSTSPR